MAVDVRMIGATDGVNKVLRAFRDLDKAASAEARDASEKIAAGQAKALTAVGLVHPDRRVQLVAGTIRTRRDRVPVIAIGGARRLPIEGGAQAGDVVYGTEWGALPAGPNSWRFPSATKGRWITPTLKRNHPEIVREWAKAIDQIVKKWS